MQQPTFLFRRTLLTSLAPLSVYALISFAEPLLKHLLSKNDPQNSLDNLSFGQNDSQGEQVLISLLSLLVQAKTIILSAYSNFLSFLVMMFLTHLAGSLLISKSDENKLSDITILPDGKQAKKENGLLAATRKEFNKRYQGVLQRIVLYCLFYYCFALISWLIGSSAATTIDFPAESVSIMSTNHNIPVIEDSHRLLEQQQELFSSDLPADTPSSFPDIRGLSIGKILSSLLLSPIDVILSNDPQIIFVVLRVYGNLRVIDISDEENPIIIGSLNNLTRLEGGFDVTALYDFKKLTLSADGKTLYASSTQYLEIIDVSDPRNPILKGTIEDLLLAFKLGPDNWMPPIVVPTMVLSPDETTLYVASIGFQIFNVTNSSNPKILYSHLAPIEVRQVTSLALLPNSKTLLYANRTIDFFDVSDPTNPQKLSHWYSDPDINFTSIRLSKNLKTIYAVGLTENEDDEDEDGYRYKKIILEKIDISQRISLGQYEIGLNHLRDPSILALSPNETNIFVTSGILFKNDFEVGMIGFDLIKKQVMSDSNILFAGVKTFVMVPGTNNIITNSDDQFHIIKLFKDYPNTRIFCSTNNLRGNYDFPRETIFIESSKGNKYLFTFSSKGVFKSYTFTSYPERIASFKPNFVETEDYRFFKLTILNKNLAVFRGSKTLSFINITDPKKMALIKSVSQDSSLLTETLAQSPQQNFLVAVWTRRSDYHFKMVDFSDLSSITETPLFSFHIDNNLGFFKKPLVINKKRILFFFTQYLNVYNISDFKMIFSKTIAPFEPSMNVLSMTLSPDEKTLFILFTKSTKEKCLALLNVSDLANPKIVSVLDLPKGEQKTNSRPFILSHDAKRGFVTTDNEILVLNLQNINSPFILGMIPYVSLDIDEETELSNFFLSSDENIGYLSDTEGNLFKANLGTPYTLYLPREKFFLGNKSSENLLFLQADSADDFSPLSSPDYKIIKLSLFDLNVVSVKYAPVVTDRPLPSWITFDYENQVLSVEPKKQKELGPATLHAILSKKVSPLVFNGSSFNETESEDLVTLLMGLGYLDNQLFLTSGFGSIEGFLLPNNFDEHRESIYRFLRRYRIETFTGFEILPSLNLSTTANRKKLLITTPSDNTIKVGIKLQSSEAKFLQKIYSTLQPIITEQKSRLTIEGPLDLVNAALRDLVINLDNPKSTCAGEITINDQMNPPIKQFYPNISEYFFKNKAPRLNTLHPLTLQQQINLTTLYTGQSFSITIDPQTFIDNYTEVLSYELISSGKTSNLPSWISHQGGLNFKGIPPEDLFNREYQLILIAKNEFKQIQVPFVLDVHVTTIFVAKLLMKYTPYILTILGFIVYANRIYNIFAKKKYRYTKDISVVVEEEKLICPLRFIAEEKAEGDILFKNLAFSEKFEEGNTRQAIRTMVNGLARDAKEKLKLYFNGGSSGQKRVEQYLFNQLIMEELDRTEEKSTKDLFENLKEKWAEFIEYNNISGAFEINEAHFDELLTEIKQKESQDLKGTLLDQVDFELLKKALIVYATKQHEIEEFDWNVFVKMKMKTKENPILNFLKLDLQMILDSEKGQNAYGIHYKIQDGRLDVSGTPHASLEGKTLVLQVVSKRKRILKELWIHGVSAKSDMRNRMSEISEHPRTISYQGL